MAFTGWFIKERYNMRDCKGTVRKYESGYIIHHFRDQYDRGYFEDNHDIPIIMKMIITGDVIVKIAH